MKRITAYLASAALGTGLIGSGPAWAQNWGWSSDIGWRGYPYNADNYAYNYGYPYNYDYGYRYPSSYAYGYGYGYPYANSYDYANPFATVTAPIAALAAATSATAPLVTGRSVATGQMGKMCSTPVKACELFHASYIGNGCSCRVTGGLSRGTVSP
jgi:hypothetical protein